MTRRRPRFLLATALSLAAGITCAEGTTGPSSGPYAQIALAPSFSPAAARIAGNLQAFGLQLDNVRIRLMRGGEGPVAKDTIIVLTNEQDEVKVELLVALKAQEERMTAIVELRSGDVTMFTASQELVLRVGRPTTQTAPLELQYIGPGANAAVLRVNPDTATLFSFQSQDFTTTAFDATGAPVSVAAIAWLVTDPTRGTISPTGRFTASALRGQTYVVALMPTGVRDSAIVSVVPTVSQVEIVSGGGQTATVGSRLGLPIVVETRAADNLPVPGSTVRFLAYQGGGSLTTTLTQSDANGRASTVLTLGTTAGVNTVLVMSGTDTLVVTATANAAAPAALAMVQQPSGTATSGVALTTQPSVRVLDAFGNAVDAPDLTVRASASGITGLLLGGNGSVITNASGVAVFTDLTLTGPVGSATLSFSSGNLTPVTSASISLAAAVVLPWQIVSADTTDRHRLTPGGQAQIRFKVLDQIGSAVVPDVPVGFTPSGSCTPLQTVATSDAAGIVSVGVSMPTGFTSCNLVAIVEQDVPLPGGGTFRPAGVQRLYAVDAAVPLWTGGIQVGDDVWDIKENWFDGVVPTTEPLVFVPGAVLAIPRMDRPTTVQTLVIENFGQLNLNGQSLTINDDLLGGGLIGNAGTVTFTAGREGLINGSVFGGLAMIGPRSPTCQPGIAYSIAGFSTMEALEINCGLAVTGTGLALSVTGDLAVTSPSGGLQVGGGAGVVVGGNALFNFGSSVVQDGSLQVLKSLVVAQLATLNQAKGLISVTEDARFDGRSIFTDGVLDLQKSLIHKGNGDSIVFSATFPHRTILRGTKDPLLISWDSPTSIAKFGQLEILDVSSGGYQFSNVGDAPVPVDHLIVGPDAKLNLLPILNINAGGVKGLGLQIETRGTLIHNGRVSVIGAQGCLPLPLPSPVPQPYLCLTP